MKNLNIASNLAKKISGQIGNFLYPNFCLCCEKQIEIGKWLCRFCSDWLVFAKPMTMEFVSTLEAEGPALSLLQGIKGSTAEKMAYTMASFMRVQVDRLSLVFPDIICVWPSDPFNNILAQHLGFFLSVPVLRPFKAPTLMHSVYRWQGCISIADQRVFLVDVKMPPKEHIAMVYEGAPKELIVFSFF